jgi:Predicted membrane protein
MSIELNNTGIIIVIAIMAFVTLVTRWAGVFIMAFIPLSPRVTRFIQAMSGSVLIAIIAPMAFSGDAGARVALLITAALMLLTKKPLLAIACGVVSAAVIRHL